MGLPSTCCCCLSLQIGCLILSGLSCVGYATTLVDAVLVLQDPEFTQFDSGDLWFGAVAIWSIIGLIATIVLVIGVANESLEAIKTYLLVGFMVFIPLIVRTSIVFTVDSLYGIKLLLMNGMNIYLYIIAFAIYRNLRTIQAICLEYRANSLFEERIFLIEKA